MREPKHGVCKSCGAPLVKQPYKVMGRKQHPWGLTVWGSRLVCSAVQKDMTQALRCYFQGIDFADIDRDWMIHDAGSQERGKWEGGKLVVPFKGCGR